MKPFDKAWALLKMPEVTLAPETMAQYFQPMRLGPAISVLQEDPAQSTIPEGEANTILEQGRGGADGVKWSPQLEVPTSSALSPETLERMRWEGYGGPKSGHTQGFKINTRTDPKALEGQPEGTTHLYTFRPRMERAGYRAPSGRQRLGADPEKENWDMKYFEGHTGGKKDRFGRYPGQGWWDQKVLHQNPTREEIARILQEGGTLTDAQDKALFRNLRHRTEEGRKINESLAADRAEAEELGKIIRRLSRAAETEAKRDVMRNEGPPVASRATAIKPVKVKNPNRSPRKLSAGKTEPGSRNQTRRKPVGVKRRRLGTVRGGPRRR
jgi:hypothetical protein